MPNKANIISSHVVLNIKTSDYGTLKLKGVIFVLGNKDEERKLVRSYCAAEILLIVRLVISL